MRRGPWIFLALLAALLCGGAVRPKPVSQNAAGHVTSITEQFASTNTGPVTSVQRSFDPYGQLATESVSGGTFGYSDSQTFDAAGRRTQLTIPYPPSSSILYGYGWRADGRLVTASDATGSGAYTYDTAGILISRQAGNRLTTIASRDGEGRPLSISTTLNAYHFAEFFDLVQLGVGCLAAVVRADPNVNSCFAVHNSFVLEHRTVSAELPVFLSVFGAI
jgi:YD repeat-containing protein